MKKLFFLLSVLVLFSCSDEPLTVGETNALKLTEVIDGRAIDRIEINSFSERLGFATYLTSDYRIEGTFLVVDFDYYDLSKLVTFERSGTTLELYFN